MKISISPEIAQKYPQARVGWLIADVDVAPSHPYSNALKAGLPAHLAELGITDDNLVKHPDISRWREVYSDMGMKPSKYRSAPEALARRIVKGQDMWNISSVVDCYDAVSVMTMLSMGAHDLTKISGDMVLRYGKDGDVFLPLGKDGDIVEVTERMVVYADAEKVCCWLWNHKDTNLAAVTEHTKEALFIVDSAFEPHLTAIEDGLGQLSHHLGRIGCRVRGSGIAG